MKRWNILWQALVSLKQALLHSEEGFYENLLFKHTKDRSKALCLLVSVCVPYKMFCKQHLSLLTDKETIIPLWAKLLQAILSRRRRNLYSFKEEVALFKSVVIFNFAWSTFTLLASQVGRKHTLKEFKLPRQEAQQTYDETKISVSRVLFTFRHLLLHQPDILRLPGFSCKLDISCPLLVI